MRICFFGSYNASAARNQVMIEGLRKNGIEVVECHSSRADLGKYLELFKKHRALKGAHDAIVVGSPGHKSVLLAKLISRKPIVFDAFFSLYDTVIFDRKLAKPGSLIALWYWLSDWLSATVADLVLLDTDAHIRYFVETFRLPKSKFHRVAVGSDTALFFPKRQSRPANTSEFLVHFHGTFIPLQGIEYIVRAAKLLEREHVSFVLYGDGLTRLAAETLAKELGVSNVTFPGKIPYREINDRIAKADISLGIFGDTGKAKRVIANKFFECIAAGSPTVTGRCPAILEFFEDKAHTLLCNMADPADLAEKILMLKNDPELRKRIAEGGYRRFLEVGTPEKIGESLLSGIRAVLSS